MEIVRGVHAIPLLRVYAHVVLEPALTLIDAGLPGSRSRIERYLDGIGRSLDDVENIICTHGHPDHAGGAPELVRPGVRLLMHPADIEGLRVGIRDAIRRPTRGRVFAAVTPTPEQAEPLADGDVLPVLGGLVVVHTPGHTPGSICLFAPRDGLLFVGDTLQRRRGKVSFASALYSDDIALARRSVQRLAELDVDIIVFSHFAPLRHGAKAVLAELARRGVAG
jgi:glyoxylase-like metal-dependent hydrolase (beta-lactamase superfamily II)